MIFKIFRNKGAGSATASVNYLVGKNHDRADATVLKGNIEVTRQLAESLDFKNRYTVGVLSFEEKDLPEQAKADIMASFESTVFAGLEQDQYSIAWVEHKDKNRLELNFFIANVELSTGKRLQPYYDRADRGLINAWKDIINHDFSLTDPNDPQKTIDLKPNQSLPRTKDELRQLIHDTIKQEVLDGNITSRDDVIAYMEQLGLEIARTTKTAVSIKDPDGGQNIRFKGEYYEQNFRIDENYTADQDRASESYHAGERERIQRARAELESRVTAKREYNQERYPSPTQAVFEHHQLSTQINDFNRGYGRYNGRNDDLHRSFNQQSNRFASTNHTATTSTGTAIGATPTQRQKVNESIFSTIERAYAGIRATTYKATGYASTAERTNNAIDERKSDVQRAIGDFNQAIRESNTQLLNTAEAITGYNREIKQREQQVTEVIAEQQKAVNQGKNNDLGR